MLTSFIQIGHAPTDSARDRRIKSIFAIAMIGGTLFPLQLIYFEDRTALELAFDWLAIIGTLGSLVVLQLRKKVDLAYVFLASIALVVLTALLLLLGNRNGDLFICRYYPFLRSLCWARSARFPGLRRPCWSSF